MNKKCLIAGLPDAGKSTYIAALSYVLQHPIKGQLLGFSEVPDKGYLSTLCDSWLSMKKVDRTTRGGTNLISFKLKKEENPDELIEITFPDMAGEDFASILHNDFSILDSWGEKPDCLLFFINKLPSQVLKEDLSDKAAAEEEVEDKQTDKRKTEVPTFDSECVSDDVKNVLLLKGLESRYSFEKVCVVLSCWDKKGSQDIPKDLLQKMAPFLYNFLHYSFPEFTLFGISAQGAEYTGKEDQNDELIKETENGTRVYLKNGNEKSYDITKLIASLL